VYEAINGASNEQLPVLFVFQDNGYGISVPKKDQTANRKVADNFSGFKNLRIFHCNGKDIFDSMNTLFEAKQWILENQNPAIVQANCVRIHSHSNSDRHDLYRDNSELSYVADNDPMAKYRRLLLRYNRATTEELDNIDKEVKAMVKDAHKKALAAPDPDPKSIHDFVIAEPFISTKYPEGIHNSTENPKKLIEAINETLKAEFKINPDTFLWGQDIANKEKGGIFNVSKGLQQEFGPERVFNAPIAEDYIVGTANGMSRYSDKIRVVVEGAEFADYFWPAMEQLVDTSHDYWRSNGKFSPNITIRLASGGYIGGGLYHSQNIEGTLTTLPGIRVVYPSFADDAAGLLRTSIRSRGLTIFLEPKALYNDPKAVTPVPIDFEVPFGKARIRKSGNDITLITYGNTTHMSLEASNIVKEKHDISIEVIDLRSLLPLDTETILASIQKTGKVLIVHEDKIFGGFGGEIAAYLSENVFEYLDGPVMRLGSTFTPVGFNPILEEEILPSIQKIVAKIEELAKY
ncbi:MAG: transketolase C-terminal domain-containing protein, partial [Salinivirgaceae bacterium]|nr:transketolase C-terminal domain-containing protein [Salinivirgaceae bacterium]